MSMLYIPDVLIKTRMSLQQLNCMHDIVFSDTLKEGAGMFKTTSKTLEKDVSSYYHDYLASLCLYPSPFASYSHTLSVAHDHGTLIVQNQREKERINCTGAYSATLL